MKKNDIFLIAGILICAFVFGIYFLFIPKSQQSSVIIYVDGIKVMEHSLWQQKEIYIPQLEGNINKLIIRDKKAWIEEANCTDKLCQKQYPIAKNGQMIICLPHKVVIEIKNGNKLVLDGITN